MYTCFAQRQHDQNHRCRMTSLLYALLLPTRTLYLPAVGSDGQQLPPLLLPATTFRAVTVRRMHSTALPVAARLQTFGLRTHAAARLPFAGARRATRSTQQLLAPRAATHAHAPQTIWYQGPLRQFTNLWTGARFMASCYPTCITYKLLYRDFPYPF